jgi:hypothetical protein
MFSRDSLDHNLCAALLRGEVLMVHIVARQSHEHRQHFPCLKSRAVGSTIKAFKPFFDRKRRHPGTNRQRGADGG